VGEISVSFGAGDNPKKRIDNEFEYEVLSALLGYGKSVVLDRGAGGEESDRIDALAQRLGPTPLLHLHTGSYASFASQVVQSDFYVGYDSAGQHVAAAAGVPLVSVFNGYISERMLARWMPRGSASRVIAAGGRSRSAVLDDTLSAIGAELAGAAEEPVD
jgi:ADP-heptose:LPS heptosyltransferase